MLENKIPPPVILLATLALIKLTSKWDTLIAIPDGISKLVAILFLFASLGIMISAVISFKNAATTVNPLKPKSSSQLVTSGVFKYSRNPMYLGMAGIAIACVFYTSSGVSIFWVGSFIVYINRYQITPEERALKTLFGAPYQDYLNQVRRWI